MCCRIYVCCFLLSLLHAIQPAPWAESIDCFYSALHYFYIIFLLFVTWCYLPMAVTRQLSFDPISATGTAFSICVFFRYFFLSLIQFSHLFYIIFISGRRFFSPASFPCAPCLLYCAWQSNVYGRLFGLKMRMCRKVKKQTTTTWKTNLEWTKAVEATKRRKRDGEYVLKMSKWWLILTEQIESAID